MHPSVRKAFNLRSHSWLEVQCQLFSAILLGASVLARIACCRVECPYRNFQLDGFALLLLVFNNQCDGHDVAFLELLFQVDQHDVITAAGLDLDGLAGGQIDPGNQHAFS